MYMMSSNDQIEPVSKNKFVIEEKHTLRNFLVKPFLYVY